MQVNKFIFMNWMCSFIINSQSLSQGCVVKMVFIYNIIYSFSWVICEVVHVIHPFSRIWEIPLLSFFFQLYWANTLEFSSQAKKFYLTSWGIIMLIRISNFLSWLSFISKSSSRIWLKMTKILTPLISRREPRHPSEQADSICIYGCKFTTTHRLWL